jgi:putative membrane protein
MLAVSLTDVAAFHLHLDVIGLVVAMAVGYEYGIRRLASQHAPRGEAAVTKRQRRAFYAGIASLLVFTTWPIHDIGEQSLYMFHMVEHLVYALVAPPLILWGTPWWLMRLLVKPVLPAMRILTKPFVALFLFNATLGLIHVPGVVELMLTSDVAHFGLHTSLFVTAILMWWPVVAPIPDLPELQPFQKMGYLFLQSLVPTVPATFLTLGDSALYKIYETFPRLWGISAHTDQVIAGLIMKIGGGLLLWGFIAGVFFTWVAEEQGLDGKLHRPARTG